MVAQSSRAATASGPPAAAAQITAEPKVKKKSKGFLSAAKAKATGGLRKALYGISSQPKSARQCRDAEDILEEDEEDMTSSNYDTVRSLPASGHYGRSRVGQHTDRNLLEDLLRVQVDDAPDLKMNYDPRMTHSTLSPVATTVIRLPRRRNTQPVTGLLMRVSPQTAAARHASGGNGGSAFDFQAWQAALDLDESECLID